LKLKNILKFTGPIKIYVVKHSKINDNWNDAEQCRFDVYSKQIINDLKRFGIGPRKSLTYDFPEWLIKHPLAHHFMRGYFDGDGSFYLNKEHSKERIVFSLRGTISFLSNYKKLLLQKCDLKSISEPKSNNGIGQLCFKGQEDVKNIIKFIYKDSTIFLERKYNITKGFIL
jgi:hypothetical protein